MFDRDALRRSAQWLAPAAVLLAALLLRVSGIRAVEAFQDRVFDAYQTLTPRRYDPGVPVRVVDIDDESLSRLGPWPWPHTLLAELTDRLSRLGASTIVFDIVFDEPDRDSPRQLLARLPDLPQIESLKKHSKELPDNDLIFAQAISRARVVEGFTMTSRPNAVRPALKSGFAYSGDSPLRYLPDYPGAVANLPELETAAAGDGCFSVQPESDGVIRRAPLLLRKGMAVYPALALEALRVFQGASSVIVKSSGASGVLSFGQHTGISQIRVGSLTLPTDGAGRLWLRYSPPAAVRSVPAWEVLAGDAPRGAFAGKIVFVGSSAQRLQDLRATPLSPVTPGVEIQAQIAEQALSGGFLRRPDWADGVEIVYTLALGALLILLLPRLGAAWCGALGLSVAAAAFPLSWYAYARLHWLLDPLFPFLSALAIYIVSSWLGYLGAERQRNRLAILDAVKDELVSTVSHDLRGPVNSMIMLTEALRLGHYGPLNEKQDRNLKMIENQGRRLVAFVANVLDAAKIKAGRLELHKQPVRPQEMIPTAVELFSLTASAKGVTLQQQVAADVPAVLADREKLEQVINNLITNAMKFTPSGGRITVAAAREGSFARFSVSDTGLGIRAEDLPKLFRPFGQVDVARQKERKITGTGLGLSICKSLVEAHGGSIAVESLGEGRGTTFHFTIPAA